MLISSRDTNLNPEGEMRGKESEEGFLSSRFYGTQQFNQSFLLPVDLTLPEALTFN